MTFSISTQIRRDVAISFGHGLKGAHQDEIDQQFGAGNHFFGRSHAFEIFQDTLVIHVGCTPVTFAVAAVSPGGTSRVYHVPLLAH